jgi:hypothetical protein
MRLGWPDMSAQCERVDVCLRLPLMTLINDIICVPEVATPLLTPLMLACAHRARQLVNDEPHVGTPRTVLLIVGCRTDDQCDTSSW